MIRISFQTIYGKLELVIAVEGWLGAYVCKSLTGFFHQIESMENVLLCDVFFIAYTLLTSYQSYFHNWGWFLRSRIRYCCAMGGHRLQEDNIVTSLWSPEIACTFIQYAELSASERKGTKSKQLYWCCVPLQWLCWALHSYSSCYHGKFDIDQGC